MKTRVLPTLFVAAVSVCSGDIDAETMEPVVSAEVVEVPAVERPTPVVTISTTPGFIAKLTPEERTAAGLEKLSTEQQGVIDAQVAREVKLARQGNVPGFAGTFISRRTEAERVAAGLGILTTGEKYQLDRLVSRALATTPPQPPVLITRPPSEADVSKPRSDWETHGFVQLEYGWGGGSEYKAGTIGVAQVNPRTGTAFTFEYTAVESDGLWAGRGCSFHAGQRVW